MNFGSLEAAAQAFTARINTDLGREAIKPITMEKPTPPPDELYFNRLVAWCYGFFFEAAADVLKECRALLKQNAPDRTNRHTQGVRTIGSLRTYKFHNLPPGGENDKKRAAAIAWLSDFQKDGQSIAHASEALCGIALVLIEDVMQLWVDATRDPEDAAQLIERVKHTLDQFWPPHELDDIVRDVAREIQLDGLDAKAFREKHIESWRQLSCCFFDRGSAEIGMRRAIRSRMRTDFGPGY